MTKGTNYEKPKKILSTFISALVFNVTAQVAIIEILRPRPSGLGKGVAVSPSCPPRAGEAGHPLGSPLGPHLPILSGEHLPALCSLSSCRRYHPYPGQEALCLGTHNAGAD